MADIWVFKKGSVDVTIDVFIVDDWAQTNPGKPTTGLVFNSAGVRAAYAKPQVVDTAVTLVTQTVAGAHVDWGFVEKDNVKSPGYYRLDLADIAVSNASDWSKIHMGFTNSFVYSAHINLPTTTPNDNNVILTSGISGLVQLEKMLISVQGAVNDATPAAGNFDTDLAQATDFWNARALHFIDGTLKGQIQQIKRTGGYVTANGHCVFETAFSVAPADGDNFVIYPEFFVVPGITRNAALPDFEFEMRKSNGDPNPGLTVTATRSIDGAAFAAATNAPTEVGGGTYKINISASDFNGRVITFKWAAVGHPETKITFVTNV